MFARRRGDAERKRISARRRRGRRAHMGRPVAPAVGSGFAAQGWGGRFARHRTSLRPLRLCAHPLRGFAPSREHHASVAPATSSAAGRSRGPSWNARSVLLLWMRKVCSREDAKTRREEGLARRGAEDAEPLWRGRSRQRSVRDPLGRDGEGASRSIRNLCVLCASARKTRFASSRFRVSIILPPLAPRRVPRTGRGGRRRGRGR